MLCGKCVLEHSNHSFKLAGIDNFIEQTNQRYNEYQISSKQQQMSQSDYNKELEGIVKLLRDEFVLQIKDQIERLMDKFRRQFDLDQCIQRIEQIIFKDKLYLYTLRGKNLQDLQ